MSTEKTADEKPKRGWWPFGGTSEASGAEDEEDRSLTASKGRATPGRRDSDPTDDGNAVTRSVGGIREYVEGVNSEIRKVTWPTPQEARSMSAIVLVATFLASVVLGIVTLSYSQLFQVGLSQPLIFLGFFVIVIVIGFVLYRRSNRDSISPY